MFKVVYKAFVATLVLALVLCGVYPLMVTGLGHMVFRSNANGGILEREGKPVGARLIGQAFSKPEYFHGRPSAAGVGYDAANSSGSNLGPTYQKLYDGVKGNVEKVLQENPALKRGEVPVDLVTASGGGLDPDVTPEGARVQIGRVAQTRGLSVEQVTRLVEEHTEGPQWGLFGESRVNVLELNLALDGRKTRGNQ